MMDLGDDGEEDCKSETNLDKLDQIMNMSDEQDSGMPRSPSKKQMQKSCKRQSKKGKQRASSRNPTAKPLFTPGKTKMLPPLE